LKLGEPDSATEDGSQLVYQWAKVKGFWMMGIGNMASSGKDRRIYNLVITFDRRGVVINRELLMNDL